MRESGEAMNSITPFLVDQDMAQVRALHSMNVDSKQFDETWLQELLFKHPDILPVHEIDLSLGKLVPLAREFPLPSGAIDLLYAAADGSLCLIETKLWRNPEAHRTVLAQILDYAKDLAHLDFKDFKAQIEAVAARHNYPRDLFKIMRHMLGNSEFDNIRFEEGIRDSLSSGKFLLLVVGDRIRPAVAMLSDIIGTAPNLEFTLRLVEITFHHLDSKEKWPLMVVPSVVGKTHEVTRAVVRIIHEQKQPEVVVSVQDDVTVSSPLRLDLETFLKSLPSGFDDVFRLFLVDWTSGPYIVYWGTKGFSLRYRRKDKVMTIIDGYNTNVSVVMEKWLPGWGNPVEAYHGYREQVNTVPEIQRVYSQGRRYALYRYLTPEQLRVVLVATDALARVLVQSYS
jgi:hypothetical protein